MLEALCLEGNPSMLEAFCLEGNPSRWKLYLWHISILLDYPLMLETFCFSGCLFMLEAFWFMGYPFMFEVFCRLSNFQGVQKDTDSGSISIRKETPLSGLFTSGRDPFILDFLHQEGNPFILVTPSRWKLYVWHISILLDYPFMLEAFCFSGSLFMLEAFWFSGYPFIFEVSADYPIKGIHL